MHNLNLSDEEFQIIDLVRKSHSKAVTHTAKSWRDEIEAAYNELQYVEPYNFEEVIDTVRQRLYGMMY